MISSLLYQLGQLIHFLLTSSSRNDGDDAAATDDDAGYEIAHPSDDSGNDAADAGNGDTTRQCPTNRTSGTSGDRFCKPTF